MKPLRVVLSFCSHGELERSTFNRWHLESSSLPDAILVSSLFPFLEPPLRSTFAIAFPTELRISRKAVIVY